jgi:hypothetical protein
VLSQLLALFLSDSFEAVEPSPHILFNEIPISFLFDPLLSVLIMFKVDSFLQVGLQLLKVFPLLVEQVKELLVLR